jgi:uncharacterized protein (DUF2252 family)
MGKRARRLPRPSARAEAARRLSPAVGERMRPAQMLGRPVFLRELRPQDLKPEISRLSPHEVLALAGFWRKSLRARIVRKWTRPRGGHGDAG